MGHGFNVYLVLLYYCCLLYIVYFYCFTLVLLVVVGISILPCEFYCTVWFTATCNFCTTVLLSSHTNLIDNFSLLEKSASQKAS
jgi:hypothetical protein